jgi:uncharacterized protein YegJ (DUF2314 family)
MKKTEENNIEWVSKGCGENRQKEWQKNNKDTSIQKGDHVKIPFNCFMSEAEGKEWMWVHIEEVGIGNLLRGTLDNEPIHKLINNLKYGDIVYFSRDKIADHLPSRINEPDFEWISEVNRGR